MNQAELRSKGTLSLNSMIPFGRKHKDKLVSQVLKDDPGYILWALENIKDYEWTPEVLAIARDSQVPQFVVKVLDLQKVTKTVQGLERGLDPIGTDGVRRVHGFPDKEDIHKDLTYLKRLLEFMQDELVAKHSLYIKV